MRSLLRPVRPILASLALGMLLVPAPALAETNVGRAVVDVVVIRPLTFVQCVVGAVFFIPAAAFTPFTERGWRGPYEVFIETPGRDLIERPLGDL